MGSTSLSTRSDGYSASSPSRECFRRHYPSSCYPWPLSLNGLRIRVVGGAPSCCSRSWPRHWYVSSPCSDRLGVHHWESSIGFLTSYALPGAAIAEITICPSSENARAPRARQLLHQRTPPPSSWPSSSSTTNPTSPISAPASQPRF